jgi:EAL domain-containing protein (putative c-di-GMP-specific phosphodiesterase class I)
VRSDDRRATLERDLPHATRRGEIVAFFQPQFSLETGEVVGAEALGRWVHPLLGLIAPGEFIPMAERLGLVGEIGDVMLRLGCNAARDWQNRGHPIEVAVNVSILQLRTAAIVDTIAGLLAEFSLAPGLLTIEVTETTPVTEVPEAIDIVRRLSGLGVNISIDDFGAAYASREQVIALQATELKVDQSLVQETQGPHAEDLARAVAFGKAQGCAWSRRASRRRPSSRGSASSTAIAARATCCRVRRPRRTWTACWSVRAPSAPTARAR